MFPSGIAANLLDRELSGVLRLGRALWWTMNTLAPDTRSRNGDGHGPTTTGEAGQTVRRKGPQQVACGTFPSRKYLMTHSPAWRSTGRSWLEDHAVDNIGHLDRHRDVSVPALTTTGWYDQQIGAIRHFTGMRENGMTELARSGQRLIIGPWSHTIDFSSSRVGTVDFGPEAVRDYFQMADDWFSYWLKGELTGVDDWPPVQIFVMGANCWRAESEWPLERTDYTDYYLRAGGLLSPESPSSRRRE